MEDFDLMAEGFDTKRRADRASIIAQKIHALVIGGHAKSALEYGCGTGLVGLELCDVFDSLLLVDSSPEMIRQADIKLRELNKPGVVSLCCDFMTNMPEGLQVDYIFSSLVLHHIKDTKAILRRFREALNDGGRVLLVDVDKEDGSFHAKYPDFEGHNGFEHQTLIDLAVAAGFSNASIETFYHGSKTYNGQENPYSLFILSAVAADFQVKLL